MDTTKIKKILLVDDDIDLLEQNKVLLENKGFSVITAENSEDGWKKFLQEKPDVAIIDLIMEEMDSGFILCYKIKKTEHGKKIPVFILTSATYDTGFKFSTSTPEEKEWIKCDGIINKPVVIEELLAKIENFY
ncbi:MAG: response regulator [Melioribacter sp.]|uniref:response regulator n=1 Tax=Rosettibacter primus TaxID=3111523 RepID=UPI00247D478C|nr:response regulator [Melioribacter sp.]